MRTSSKPPWDKSKPGEPTALYVTGKRGPAFGPPTEEEIEAARKAQKEALLLHGGMGRAQMGPKQKWHAQAIAREALHRTNLEFFLTVAPKRVGGAKRKSEQIRRHRYGLVSALRDLGRFQEALAAASNAKGRALPGFRILTDQIMEWGMAVARDDTHEHDCPRRTEAETIPGAIRNKPVEIEVEMPRRHKIAQVFSLKHGKVVDIWRCSQCGHLNAHDLGPPEHQAEMHRLRALVETGMRPTPEMMDHVLFATKK